VSEARPSAGWRRVLKLVRMDLSPLRRYPDYRRLFLSGGISTLGSYITMVAAPLQLKILTGSYVVVGLIGAVELLPMLVFGLLGGAIADALDRRRVILSTEAVQLLCSAALMANALLARPQIWVIFAVAAVAVSASSIQRPSTEAMLARLVDDRDQSAASAMRGLQDTAGSILSPALGGVLAAWSLPAAYGVDVASFALSLVLLVRLPRLRPTASGATVSLAGIAEGARYALGRRDLLGTYLVDIAAMAFAMPEALFPFFADELRHPNLLGLFYSATAVGAAVVTLTSGWTARIRRHGRAIVLAALGWGAAITLAGLAPGLWLVLSCLALAGAADMVSGIFRSTIWNQTIPDHLRGRLAGIELLSYSTGPTLGNARAGFMARLGGVRFSVAAGGLLCMVSVVGLAAVLPGFRRYDAGSPDSSATVGRAT
jgi:MFS family permease